MTQRTSLTPYASGMQEPHPEHARSAARAAWQHQGLILINPAWLTSWEDRKQAELLADKLHGRRKDSR